MVIGTDYERLIFVDAFFLTRALCKNLLLLKKSAQKTFRKKTSRTGEPHGRHRLHRFALPWKLLELGRPAPFAVRAEEGHPQMQKVAAKFCDLLLSTFNLTTAINSCEKEVFASSVSLRNFFMLIKEIWNVLLNSQPGIFRLVK